MWKDDCIFWTFARKFFEYTFVTFLTGQSLRYVYKRRGVGCQKNLLVKSSENKIIFSLAFYLTLRLMKLPEKFKKIPILKTWQLVFFWGVKTYLGILPLKWCIFRHEKNWFSQILPSIIVLALTKCSLYCL